MSKTVSGRDLRVDDVIEVWWSPHRDVITELLPYRPPQSMIASMGAKVWEGARIATFAINPTGMTIFAGDMFEVVTR